jgi:hypothetical protein
VAHGAVPGADPEAEAGLVSVRRDSCGEGEGEWEGPPGGGARSGEREGGREGGRGGQTDRQSDREGAWGGGTGGEGKNGPLCTSNAENVLLHVVVL